MGECILLYASESHQAAPAEHQQAKGTVGLQGLQQVH